MASIEDESTSAEAPPIDDDGPWVLAGRYEIRALLGVGGMGSVYKAFDRELEEVVALKIIRRELLRVPGIVDRFRREVRLSRLITHRNVARVFDLGESQGDRYFTMEFIDGRSLDATLDDGPLPLKDALSIGRGVALGIAAAHTAGVIHRDLKPDNILLTSEGDRAVITDFGIARSLFAPSGPMTLQGGWLGTPIYMAPELVAGEQVADELCDIFSLGVVLFEALTNHLPWEGKTDVAIALERLTKDPRDPRDFRPDLPSAFAKVVLGCLARDRSKRLRSAQLVADMLRAVLLSEPAPATSASLAITQTGTHPAWTIDTLPIGLSEATRGPRKSVAVLPFRRGASKSAPDAESDHYLVEGLTEALIEALSNAPLLAVRPHGMVARYRDSELSSLDVGRELGVHVVIDGVLTRDETRSTLVVRAISVIDRFPLWSSRFERPRAEILGLVSDIARSLAGVLSVDGVTAVRAVVDPVVGELYMRAREAYNGFWASDAKQAVALFEQALALAPDNPLIISGYALACIRESTFRSAGIDRAVSAIERATAIDPDLAELHLARGALLMQGTKDTPQDPVGAALEIKAALARSPSLGEANYLLGRALVEAGVIEAGMKRLEWALTIEPSQHLARRDLSRANALLGRFDEAERIAASETGRGEIGAWLDRARFALWHREAHIAAGLLQKLELAKSAQDGERPLDLARAFLRLAALKISPLEDPAFVSFVRSSQGTPRRASFAAQIEAEVYATLGRDADALASIARSVDNGLADLGWLDRCPVLDALRGEPEYHAARVKVGELAAGVREAIYGD